MPLFSDTVPTQINQKINLSGVSLTNHNSAFFIGENSSSNEVLYSSAISSESFITNNANWDLAGYNSNQMLGSQGLISYGEGLTQVEMDSYYQSANKLMTAMGVNVYTG